MSASEIGMTLQDADGQFMVVFEESRNAPDAMRWVALYPDRLTGCRHLARVGVLSQAAADTILGADLALAVVLPTRITDPKQTLRGFHSSCFTPWQ